VCSSDLPNKIARPIRALAADHCEGAISKLVWLRDNAESEQVQLMAANALLDRGLGKPRQEMDVTKNTGVRVIVYGPPVPVLDVQPESMPDRSLNGPDAYDHDS